MEYPKPTLIFWIMIVLSPLGSLSGFILTVFRFAEGLILPGLGYLALAIIYGAMFIRMLTNYLRIR